MAGLLGVDEQTLTPKNIIGGDELPLQKQVTIAAGAALVKGTVLGIVTLSGKYAPYVAGHSDGTEVARAILLEDAAAASADVLAQAGFVGKYVEAQLTGLDAAGKLLLQDRGIVIE